MKQWLVASGWWLDQWRVGDQAPRVARRLNMTQAPALTLGTKCDLPV